MITERDMKIAKWIDKIKATQTNHVAAYWWGDKKYPKIQARKRLSEIYKHCKDITDMPNIKRTRDHINMQYTYYTCSKKQIEHQLQLANFLVKLREIKRDIIPFHHYETEYVINHVKVDMAMKYEGNTGEWHLFFIESHNKSDKFNFEKYEKLYQSDNYDKFYKDFFGRIPSSDKKIFPKVIIISNKKIKLPKYSEIKFIQIKKDCSDIRKIFV